MNKKICGSLFAVAFGLTSAVCLAACDKEVRYYFTMEEAPAHCSISTSGWATDNAGKTYLLEEQEFSIYVSVDEGYYSDDFKLLINQQEVEVESDSTHSEKGYISSYSYSFLPKSDFTVSFSGEFKQIKANLSFKKESGYNEEGVEGAFIRFKQNSLGLPTTNITITQFEAATREFNKELAYGETLEFYVFTTDYVINREPDIISLERRGLDCEFYMDEQNNEYGAHYTYTQYESDTVLKIRGFSYSFFSICTAENHSVGNNITSEKLDIEIIDNNRLIITLKNYANIPDDVLESLRLTVNSQLQDVNFKTSPNKDGVFTVQLNNPYEYYVEEHIDLTYAYRHLIDLNFYELEYFAGLEISLKN